MPSTRNPKFASIGLVEIGEELARSKQDPIGGLVGQFFHSDAARGWQGRIEAQIEPSVYLVALFDWIIGQETRREIVPLEEMQGWVFYESDDDMRFAYEHGGVQQRWDAER
jgi:hypothetical protein